MIEKRKWHWMEWLFFGIFTFWMILNIVELLIDETISSSIFITAISGTLISYFTPLIFWRPGYINKLAFPIAILLTSGVIQVSANYSFQEITQFITIPLIIVGFLAIRRTMWWSILIFIIGLPLIDLFILKLEQSFGDFISHVLNLALAYGVGFSVNKVLESNLKAKQLYEENLRQYRQINDTLEQYATQVEKLTLLEERSRMAREMHDTVGHTFTSVIIGMDVVSYLIHTSPDQASEKLDVLRDVTRNGLEQIRRSIHQISIEEGTFLQQLSLLANEFAIHTQTQVYTELIGSEKELPKPMQLALIRCLQESLTNAKRHGQATDILISVCFYKHYIELRVKDNGGGSQNLEVGFGLTGMKERLDALQGTLEIHSVFGGGTIVTCAIPIR